MADAAKPTVDGIHDDEQVVLVKNLTWLEVFSPETVTKLMHKKFGMFGAIVGFYYCANFVMCVAACNFYSDISRLSPCVINESGIVLEDDEASKVFDMAIKLTGVFHIIEWVRTTLLLTVIMIGVNLMKVWYVSLLNMVYGIVSFLFLHAVYFSEESNAC